MTSVTSTRVVALYRYYAADGGLLYIGIAFDPQARAKQHAATKKWWHDVDQGRTSIEWLADRESAEGAELAAIRAELPKHNIVTSDENGCARYLPHPEGRSWGKPSWTPETATEAQLRLRAEVAEAATKAKTAEEVLYDKVRQAHEAGVPMEDLAEQAQESRATLFRKLKAAKQP